MNTTTLYLDTERMHFKWRHSHSFIMFHHLSKSSKHHGHDANCADFSHIFQPLKKATARNVTDIGSLHVAPNHSRFLRVKKRPAMLLTLVLCTLHQTIPDHCAFQCHLLGIRFLSTVGQNPKHDTSLHELSVTRHVFPRWINNACSQNS